MTPPKPDMAQLFEMDGIHAVRLPEAYRLEGNEVIVKRVGDSVLLPRNSGWKNLLSSVEKFDGFQIERDQGREQERDWGDLQLNVTCQPPGVSGQAQQCSSPCQHFRQRFLVYPSRELGAAGTPVHATHVIGDGDSLHARPLRKGDLERESSDPAGDRDGDEQTSTFVVPCRGQHQPGTPPTLLMPSMRREVDPNHVPTVRDVPGYHSS